MWILVAVVVLVGFFFVVRTLHRLLQAARQLQRTVNTLKGHVDESLVEIDKDVKSLGDSIEETRRK